MAPEWIYLLKVNAGIALFYAFTSCSAVRTRSFIGVVLPYLDFWRYLSFIRRTTSNIG